MMVYKIKHRMMFTFNLLISNNDNILLIWEITYMLTIKNQ